MLDSITIKNCATYDNFGCQINHLNKINFIYGANGTGKTTISNFLKDPDLLEYSDCKIYWQDSPLEILVYNKKFREDNFTNGDIKGIFTLGTATQQEQQLIRKKEVERDAIKNDGLQKRITLDKQKAKLSQITEHFQELLWKNYYKTYSEYFKPAFKGANYKRTFKKKLLTLHSSLPVSAKSFEELKTTASTIFADTPPTPLPSIAPINIDNLINIEKNAYWHKAIVGKSDVSIANLIQQLNLTDWVSQGKQYVDKIESETCPFCQQKTITEDFKFQLESYFDTSYLYDLEQIKQMSENYDNQITIILSSLNNIKDSQLPGKNIRLDLDKFTLLVKTIEQHLLNNKEKIQKKVKEPSRRIELISSHDFFVEINQLIKQTNIQINRHNKIVNNFRGERLTLIEDIWDFLILQAESDINNYLNTCNGLRKGIRNLEIEVQTKRDNYQQLTNEIINLQDNLTNIEPTINDLNRLLTYYGFINFHIVKSSQDGFYQIQRNDGSLAHATLSEGEVTFITFLYFLQLSKGAIDPNKISNQRVVVIDDPISSLDSNILFVVSTLIKSLINDVIEANTNVKQLFILTHNVYFHKETTFRSARDNEFKDVNHWIVRKNDNVSTIESYGNNNPIKSSYTLLWDEYQNSNITSTISIQNIMRRIIENYFKFLGGYKDNDLINQFNTEEERKICSSLISWINDGSHSVNDDLFIESSMQSIDTYKKVFKNIFDKTGHIAHYQMMMKG